MLNVTRQAVSHPLLLVGSLFLAAAAHAAKTPEPIQRIPLAPLGYQPIQTRYLTAGGTMFTVHFVDPTHLLATWSTRGLITRLPDAQPDDQDRNVEAVLLELPSAKVLARTTWRMRDHAQYLWPLGRGHFLLRLRNELFSISPLEDLPTGHAFERHLVLETKRPIGLVAVSPDSEVVIVETLPPPAPKTSPSKSGLVLQPRPDTSIQINFYRIGHRDSHPDPPAAQAGAGGPQEANGHIFLSAAGAVRATNAILLPLTGDGYLDVVKESSSSYSFDFAPYQGKRIELPVFDTSCYPHVYFVSRSDFISFGCRGSDDHQELGFFNLRGDHPWLSTFPNRHINPFIISVPEAGRFALSRTVVTSAALDLNNIVEAELGDQEVTVLQSHDGRQLLRVLPTPIQRAGQNFDLAPDGLSFAIFRAENIEIYRLPPLSRRDQQEIAATATLAPPPGSGLIRIAAKSAKDDTPPASEEPASAALPVRLKPLPAPANTAASPPTQPAGDIDSTGAARKPPTLYDPEHPKPPN